MLSAAASHPWQVRFYSRLLKKLTSHCLFGITFWEVLLFCTTGEKFPNSEDSQPSYSLCYQEITTLTFTGVLFTLVSITRTTDLWYWNMKRLHFSASYQKLQCHSLHKGDTKQVREKLQGAHKFQFQISDTHWPKKGFPSFGYQGTKLYILIPDLSRESRRGLSWQLLFWILPEGGLSYWEQSGTWPQRHYCKNCRRKSWESS